MRQTLAAACALLAFTEPCRSHADPRSSIDPLSRFHSDAAGNGFSPSQAPTSPLPLVPTPTTITLSGGPPVTITSAQSRIVYTDPALASAAAVLAQDLQTMYQLSLPVVMRSSGGNGGGSSDISLVLKPSQSPTASPTPPPSPPPPPTLSPQCSVTAGIKLNNTAYADPNGPRTTASAEECCELCEKTAGCGRWSFQIDPTVSGTVCHWATLTYCCWMHKPDATGGADAVHAAGWTSGTTPPPPPPPVMPKTLPPQTPPDWPTSAYTLTVSSDHGVVIASTTVAGVVTGQATVLQSATLVEGDGGGRRMSAVVRVPAMEVEDIPFREWRGVQLDLHGTPYHSIDSLKTYIRLARFYKLNVLTFNVGPSIWLSPTLNSTSKMNASWRAGVNPFPKACYNKCIFYTEAEIADLVAYGAARAVRLVPFTNVMPGMSEMVRTLNQSLLPPEAAYPFHDWMDEVDGKGPSTYTGEQTGPAADRFWNFMGVVIERVYRLFAAGWPNGVLPTWHVGAVEGEGGMDGPMLRKMHDRIQAAARAVHGPSTRNVTVGSYDGINARDPAIADITANLVTHFYTQTFSQSSLQDYVEAGWQVVDISWVPLYVVSAPYTPEQVFQYFNLFWASEAAGKCWTGSVNLTTNCAQYWIPGRETQTLGAILSTWTAKQPDELGLVRMRMAPFVEHVWGYRPFPYPLSGPGSWRDFAPRAKGADVLLDRLIGPVAKPYRCNEATLMCEPLPQFPNGSSWTNGTDYESDCGGPCCGRRCPGPPAGVVYGGRLWDSTGSPSTAMQQDGKVGIAAADAMCLADAVNLNLVSADAPASELRRYRALLADETGCEGKPCRRATVTPGVGDGAIDWVIAPNAAYYMLDNVTLITWSNASAMLGVANHTKIGRDNQLSPFGPGWVTLENRTCNSWRWARGMQGGPYGKAVGSAGWIAQPFTATAGVAVGLPCDAGDFICVEMARVGSA